MGPPRTMGWPSWGMNSAVPKSERRLEAVLPMKVRRVLSPLTSRWMMPLSWQKWRAAACSAKMRWAKANNSGHSRAAEPGGAASFVRSSARLPPSAIGSTARSFSGRPLSSLSRKYSIRGMMLGWASTDASARISCLAHWMRKAEDGPDRSMILAARWVPVPRSTIS